MASSRDTIFALSSGALPSGVAVVRVSGTLAFSAVELLAGSLPEARKAALKTIRTRNNKPVDRALVLVFPGPASFTGEDSAEFHLHGGRAVVECLLHALGSLPGFRQAEAGEFSRRAFENGKADLVEMEGLADLISAETEMQRRLAVEQSFGGVSRLYTTWAERLTRARALIEAELDFADEEDVPGSVSDLVWSDLGGLAAELRAHVAAAGQGEIIRNGLKVVIAGPPNAGKSSLMNALAGRDLAIVTELAGTTRDILHADIDVNGFLVRLYDTAGLREAAERIEQEGVRRALSAIENADLVLYLEEIGRFEPMEALPQRSGRVVRVGTKLDRHQPATFPLPYDICISTADGSGLERLKALMVEDLEKRQAGGEFLLPGRSRQVGHLKRALSHLEEALGNEGMGLDLRSESLRLSAHELGKITGRVDVEQLLDVIFSEFCVGK